MEGNAGNTVHEGIGHEGTRHAGTPHGATGHAGTEPTGAAVILRVLRVSLHVGFAVLLLVALVRLVAGGITGQGWVTLLLALLLAAFYLAGTVLEKRHAAHRTRFDPRPYSAWWLGGVSVLWLLLIWTSADFVWLAFPLFFLELHVLRRRLALPAIALSTLFVIGALWFHNGGIAPPELPMVLGPAFGAAFAVVTGLAYRALFLEAENQRLAAEELRRTRAELARTQHNAGTLAERTRLAREIHDTLAQGLSSIVLMGRAAEKALDDGEPAVARERLRIVRDTAAANLAEARNFVRALQSPDLEDGSLVAGLLRLCEKTEAETAARGTGLRCRLDVEGVPVELPAAHQTALLRAAQASLANVRIHAQASTAVVTLSFLGPEVAMDIYDDGTGFDPAALPARPDGSGYGLTSLRERVAALHGQLDIESAPGEGTVVAIRLPLGDEPGTAPGSNAVPAQASGDRQ
ncbi:MULTISPECIES: sensor histidine kinase [unclassified Arthrobacter]|uniref:sensor histidine kinase n=1 Tax=unclassified Arthrobacter TaxID=235627 RepID=UPI001DDFAEDE|nr:sensor histidine kinase [Arthrobacter sp. Bi26]CAH0196399.1 Sensor histidine kinase LiaS [Arthrobacter sp. Bi26]